MRPPGRALISAICLRSCSVSSEQPATAMTATAARAMRIALIIVCRAFAMAASPAAARFAGFGLAWLAALAAARLLLFVEVSVGLGRDVQHQVAGIARILAR